MNILFIAPSYIDLYKPIKKELERKGHEVAYYEDINLKFDSNFRVKTCKNSIKKAISLIFHYPRYYWKKQIRNNEILKAKYDLLFVINGCSISSYLIKFLRKNNPQIKTSLYLWDTDRYYNYFRNAKYFDSIFTFDIKDYEHFKKIINVKFLPFYWCKTERQNSEPKYDLSIVGTNHDGRLDIIRILMKQIKEANLSYYIKILDNDANSKVNEDCDDIITHEMIPIETVNSIINDSICIIDTDRESQTGTTPRIIWALSQEKKIISTNENLKKMPFYNENQIFIIDRRNPVLDIDFIKDERYKKFPINEYLLNLRIDNWVKNFL